MTRARHRVTFAGLIFTGVTAFVMVAAVNSQSNLLFWALGLMVGGLFLSGVLSWMMLRKLTVRRIAESGAVAGLPANVHYVLSNGKKRWPAFAVRVREANFDGQLSGIPDGYCLHVGPKGSVTMMTQLIAPHRGRVLLRDVEISCAFPFGFLAHSIYANQERQVVVFPRIGVLSSRLASRYRETITSGSMTSSMRGGQDEFYGLREYRPGDSVRAIHWKRSARTGEIVVREMTANAPPQMIVALNLRTWRDLPDGREKAERAIELAASLLCYGSVENFAIGLVIPGLPDQAAPTTQMGRDVRARLLEQLAVLQPEQIGSTAAPPQSGRLGRRAEWIVVTLAATDAIDDIVPPGGSSSTMALDAPDAATWIHFVAGPDALRMLRQAPSRTARGAVD